MVVFEFETPQGYVKATRTPVREYKLELCVYNSFYCIESVKTLEKLEKKYWKTLKKHFL
jgi:hypothetical protein